MGLPVLEGAFRVQLLFAGGVSTRPWSTKFDYTQPEPVVAPGAVADVAAAFRTALDASWTTGSTTLRSVFGNEMALNAIRVYALSDPLQGVEVTPVNPITGTGTANRTPGEVAIVTSLRTNLLGRRYRGRQYWGSIGATGGISVSTGIVAPAAQTALAGFVDRLRVVDLGESDMLLSVLSTAPLPTPVPDRPPATGQVVTSVTVDTYPDTQRRRGPR
jgi:hypothetical protein